MQLFTGSNRKAPIQVASKLVLIHVFLAFYLQIYRRCAILKKKLICFATATHSVRSSQANRQKRYCFHFAQEVPMTLDTFFKQNPKVALAFSGGVDSAYLPYAAIQSGGQIRAYYVK